MIPVGICLCKNQVMALDKLAKQKGVSRSELLREIVDRHLHDLYRQMNIFEILTKEQMRLLE